MKKNMLSGFILGFSIFTAMSAFSFVTSEMTIQFMAYSSYEWLEWSLLVILFSLLLIFSTTLSRKQLIGILIGYLLLPFSFLYANKQIHFFLLKYNTGICFGLWSVAMLTCIQLLSRSKSKQQV